MTRILLALLLTLQTAFIMAAQQPAKAAPSKTAAKKANPANDIFSGTVTATGADSVMVVRKVPARVDETRQFVIDKDTKVEGKLKLNARVTVRFRADADGAIRALRVIVRADAKTSAGAGRGERTGPAK